MFISVDSPESHKYIVTDAYGQVLPYVQSANTETEVVEMLVCIGEHTEKMEGDPIYNKKFIFTDVDGKPTPLKASFRVPGLKVTKKD